MTTPRTKKMLLLAAATIASPAACNNETKVSGFYGEIAYDGGYEEAGYFANPDATPDTSDHVDASAADAAADAEVSDAGGDADADADAAPNL
jgi:hypothetical protein